MWNGGHHHHSIEQQQKPEEQQDKLDAVSALASFQQGRFSARDRYPEAYHLITQQQQQPQTMSRQFSDGSADGGGYVRPSNATGYVDATALLSATQPYFGNGTGGIPASYTAAVNGVATTSGFPSSFAAAETYAPPERFSEAAGIPAATSTGSFGYSPEQQYVEPPRPRGKPEAMARALAASQLEADRQEAAAAAAEEEEPLEEDEEEEVVVEEPVVPPQPSPRKTPKKAKSPAPKKAKKKPPASQSSLVNNIRKSEFSLDEPAPPIREEEYLNLDELMTEFCRVPLLAEFSRPVSLLHPDVSVSFPA